MKRINLLLCLLILIVTIGAGTLLFLTESIELTLPTIRMGENSIQGHSISKPEQDIDSNSNNLPDSSPNSSNASSSISTPQQSRPSSDNSESTYVQNSSQSSLLQSQQPQQAQRPADTQSSPLSLEESSTNTVTFPININTATKEEFMALPEIDEEKANVILHFREQAGSFSSTEDIKKALWKYDGVAIFYKIKDYIICE